MKILESFVKGKHDDPARCEDGIFVNEKVIAVIDGVTSKSSRKYEGKSSGRKAMEIVKETLSGLPEISDPETFLNLLARSIDTFARQNDCQGNEIPRACIIAYLIHARLVVSYGDCQCRLNGKTYRLHKQIDQMNETLRAYVIETALRQGQNVKDLLADDPGRNAVQPFLKSQYLFENQAGPFGYAVLNGSPVNPSMMQIMQVPAGQQVILASDGYPELKDTLDQSEKALAELLAEDPLCFRMNRQTKGMSKGQISYDDRSYIRFVTD